MAIEAFNRIGPALPDVRLLMAGDGPMRAELEARVAPALRDRVEFLGAVFDQRPELLASSSLFLLPARAVGFSIMVLEAFAAGLPVVALPGLGTDRAGEHWSNVIMAKDRQRRRRSPPPSSRPCSATSASASRAGAPSPTRSTGTRSAAGSSTSSSASPGRGARGPRLALAGRRVTSAKTSMTGAGGLVLRCVPLCLLAVVLWREKPWTVRALAERALGGDGVDPAQLRRLPAAQGGALAAWP